MLLRVVSVAVFVAMAPRKHVKRPMAACFCGVADRVQCSIIIRECMAPRGRFCPGQ